MYGWPRLILEKVPIEECEKRIEKFLHDLTGEKNLKGLIIAGADNHVQKSALIKEVCQRRGYLYSPSPNFNRPGAWRVIKNELFT